MKSLIELNDKQSETLAGGWYLATNQTDVTQSNAAANVALALGGPVFIANGQFNNAIMASWIA